MKFALSRRIDQHISDIMILAWTYSRYYSLLKQSYYDFNVCYYNIQWVNISYPLKATVASITVVMTGCFSCVSDGREMKTSLKTAPGFSMIMF